MDELNDLISATEGLIADIKLRCKELEKAVQAAEAVLAKWADEEGRLADREG